METKFTKIKWGKGLRKEREVKGSENENCEGEGAKTNWEGKEEKNLL